MTLGTVMLAVRVLRLLRRTLPAVLKLALGFVIAAVILQKTCGVSLVDFGNLGVMGKDWALQLLEKVRAFI